MDVGRSVKLSFCVYVSGWCSVPMEGLKGTGPVGDAANGGAATVAAAEDAADQRPATPP